MLWAFYDVLTVLLHQGFFIHGVISLAINAGLNGEKMEAASGFEPLNGSFADCSLTTWVRRLELYKAKHATILI